MLVSFMVHLTMLDIHLKDVVWLPSRSIIFSCPELYVWVNAVFLVSIYALAAALHSKYRMSRTHGFVAFHNVYNLHVQWCMGEVAWWAYVEANVVAV